MITLVRNVPEMLATAKAEKTTPYILGPLGLPNTWKIRGIHTQITSAGN